MAYNQFINSRKDRNLSIYSQMVVDCLLPSVWGNSANFLVGRKGTSGNHRSQSVRAMLTEVHFSILGEIPLLVDLVASSSIKMFITDSFEDKRSAGNERNTLTP